MRLHDHPGSLSDVQGIHHYKKLCLMNTVQFFGLVDFLYGTRKPVVWFYLVAFCLWKYDGKMYDFLSTIK